MSRVFQYSINGLKMRACARRFSRAHLKKQRPFPSGWPLLLSVDCFAKIVNPLPHCPLSLARRTGEITCSFLQSCCRRDRIPPYSFKRGMSTFGAFEVGQNSILSDGRRNGIPPYAWRDRIPPYEAAAHKHTGGQLKQRARPLKE